MSESTIYYTGPIVTRVEALKKGLKKYFTDKPCKHGHVSQRYLPGSQCVYCCTHRVEYSKNWKKLNSLRINACRRSDYKNKKEYFSKLKKEWRSNPHNKAKELAYSIEYKTKNKELIAERVKERRRKNPEPFSQAFSKYYYKNLEKMRERTRQDRIKNPDKHRSVARNRYALKKYGCNGRHYADEIKKLLLQQNYKCVNCKCCLKTNVYNADHIMPLALGGENTIRNIQMLCKRCNQKKNKKHPIDWALQNGRLV